MTFSPGDIVLSRFPFTDLRQAKLRPVLVISPAEYSQQLGDIVALALTTKPHDSTLKLQHWQESGLPRETWLKPVVATFKSHFIVKKIGVLSHDDLPTAGRAVATVVDPRFSG